MRTGSIIVTAVSVLLFTAGCAAEAPEPSPTPSETTEARCTPENSEVTWGELAPAPRTPVGYRTITTDASATRTVEQVQWSYRSSVMFSLAGDPRTDDPEWVDFLVDDLNRQEDTTPEFGDPVVRFDPDAVEPSEPGDYVVLYDLEQLSVPFSIACGGPGEGEGVLTSSRGGMGTTFAACESPLPADDPLAPTLTEACTA